MNAKSIIGAITDSDTSSDFKELHWTGSFLEYLDMVSERPAIARTSFQRVCDMICSYGYEKYTEYKKEIKHYKFFDDPFDNGKDAIFGLDVHLEKLVNVF